jgi:5-methyltetrahydropteroyltriglutamate--homocysteine methyltransferase
MAIADVLRQQVREIDAAVIQVDEAHVTGHPEDLAWAHESINHVLGAIQNQKGVHLCFGNYGGQSIQKGTWRQLSPFLNALTCDHLILEFARRGYDELECLRDLRPGIALGIGVVDIKDNEIESADEIARRIGHTVKILGEPRVRWVHPDCGFWMLPRPVADRKMAALTAGRNLFYGEQAP